MYDNFAENKPSFIWILYRREFYIKETDSPYIRKAKQGGTKDLLSFDADVSKIFI